MVFHREPARQGGAVGYANGAAAQIESLLATETVEMVVVTPTRGLVPGLFAG
jgi:hypothetical protein